MNKIVLYFYWQAINVQLPECFELRKRSFYLIEKLIKSSKFNFDCFLVYRIFWLVQFYGVIWRTAFVWLRKFFTNGYHKGHHVTFLRQKEMNEPYTVVRERNYFQSENWLLESWTLHKILTGIHQRCRRRKKKVRKKLPNWKWMRLVDIWQRAVEWR